MEHLGLGTCEKEHEREKWGASNSAETESGVSYTKNMGGVDTDGPYTTLYCILRKTMKLWQNLFFCGMELSKINAYILYKEICKKNKSKPVTHVKFK
jgi:hypothetical protein